MRLLFITQKLHGQDAFTRLWVEAFMRKGYDVMVLCLEDRVSPQPYPIYSLGKEKGTGKIGQILRFWKLITTLQYDRVFIHMTPVWGLFGAWWWIPRRTRVYLWYTHYKMQAGLWLLGFYGKRFFCATPQSLPQYQAVDEQHPEAKKVVTGHGIDMAAWPKRSNTAADPTKLLMVHRLARSKRVELTLRALTLLPGYTLDIYGQEVEPDYAAELRALTAELGLTDRVVFHGSMASDGLAALYTSHRLILNMASETIDKTMLEAMTCGCYPLTTAGNAGAIGIDLAPQEDTAEAIARFVTDFPGADADRLFAIVRDRHSLDGLIAKMDTYITPGI